ncbi:hypothetical protein Scep_029236 [Stephania cephalantha]|uniref:Uncharacterized protein n=1 Tax=Stephania cephalantha TaxID=152367 RepID=A0AAP0DX91_9MAGN
MSLEIRVHAMIYDYGLNLALYITLVNKSHLLILTKIGRRREKRESLVKEMRKRRETREDQGECGVI